MQTATSPQKVERAHAPTRPRQVQPASGWPAHLKRAVEFVLALVLMILSLPLMVVAAALVKLSSPGSVFYSQIRLGLNGAPYRLYKLRTMYENCERESGPRWSTPGDSRITRLGEFLRHTHLDELPQLWNVLRGEMSLIGPRPERPEFVPALAHAVPLYRDRLLVLPGVTGLAQVNLPADADLNSVRNKLAYDLYYVANESPWLDLRILVATALKVLGVPLWRLRSAVAMPDLEAVETHYRQLCEESVPTSESPPTPSQAQPDVSLGYTALLLPEQAN